MLQDFSINEWPCGCWKLHKSNYVHVCKFHENNFNVAYYYDTVSLSKITKVLSIVNHPDFSKIEK